MNGTVRPPVGFAADSGPAAAVLIAAFLFLLHSLQRGQASVVIPIAQMDFVLAAALGVIFVHESLTARKMIGLDAAFAALLVLAIG